MSAFLFLLVVSSANGFSLTVLHTNDNHGRIEETDTHGFLCFPNDAQAGRCFGGMARRATMIKQIRAREKNVLLLCGGDVLTGTPWYKVYRGNASRIFMNELGYNAMALGNHEFDDGIDNLVSFLSGLNFAVVSSNLNVSHEPKWPRSPPLFVRSKVLEVGGQKIGIVGYVLKSTPLKAWPGPGPNIKFLSEVESVRSAVKELQRQNINKIIAVGHSGIEVDKQVATEVDGVDIVVGGHSNTFLYKGTPPSTETPYGSYPLVITPKSNPKLKALVVQDFAFGKYLGHLKVEFDENGNVISWSGNPILLNNSVRKDPVILQQVLQMKTEVAKMTDVKVGSSFVFLNGSDCMWKECNLGNVITDAFVFHYANQSANDVQWTDASIAVQHGKSVKASIPVSAQENVTYGHIANIVPYKALVTVDVVELKGRDMLQLFERLASKFDGKNPSDSFLQVSGLQITYDIAKTPGKRVVDFKVRCAACRVPAFEPLDKSAVYKVILTSKLARDSFVKEKRLSHRVGITDDMAIVNYFKARSPVTTGVEGRITFADTKDGAVICSGAGSLQTLNMLLAPIIIAQLVVYYMV